MQRVVRGLHLDRRPRRHRRGRSLSPRVGAYGRVFGELYGVDIRTTGAAEARHPARRPGRSGRPTVRQAAARWSCSPATSGVIDADPLDRQARQWPFAGFRLVELDSFGAIIGRMTYLEVSSPALSRSSRPSLVNAAALSRAGGRPAAQAAVPDDRRCRTALTVILSEDHSTPIVHLQLMVSRRLEEREAGPHRLRASLRAHDVQGLEERRARSAHLDHRLGRRPEQRLHDRRRDGVLGDGAGAVPAAGAVARGRPDGDAAHRRGHVRRTSARWSRKSGGCGSTTSRTAG